MTMDNNASTLQELGWNSFFSECFESLQMPDAVPARVVSERRNSYQVYSQYGELSAEISGKMRYQATAGGQYPAVGDWVVIRPQLSESTAVIQSILQMWMLCS
jgi:ribosome biogenesis GTPase